MRPSFTSFNATAIASSGAPWCSRKLDFKANILRGQRE